MMIIDIERIAKTSNQILGISLKVVTSLAPNFFRAFEYLPELSPIFNTFFFFNYRKINII